jgi:hypothetical protein
MLIYVDHIIRQGCGLFFFSSITGIPEPFG